MDATINQQPANPGLGLFQFTHKTTGETRIWRVMRAETDPETGERLVYLAFPDDPLGAAVAESRDEIKANYRVALV